MVCVQPVRQLQRHPSAPVPTGRRKPRQSPIDVPQPRPPRPRRPQAARRRPCPRRPRASSRTRGPAARAGRPTIGLRRSARRSSRPPARPGAASRTAVRAAASACASRGVRPGRPSRAGASHRRSPPRPPRPPSRRRRSRQPSAGGSAGPARSTYGRWRGRLIRPGRSWPRRRSVRPGPVAAETVRTSFGRRPRPGPSRCR